VKLIPPAYVKPFVKRQKNDMADAEAIAEAAARPPMRFVAVKSEEQQAMAMAYRTLDLLVRQRPSQRLRRRLRLPRARPRRLAGGCGARAIPDPALQPRLGRGRPA
jgi:transposase